MSLGRHILWRNILLDQNGQTTDINNIGEVSSPQISGNPQIFDTVSDELRIIDEIDNILELDESEYRKLNFKLAKNKARFLRLLAHYRGKETWLQVASLSGVSKLFKQETKKLEGIRSNKLDYEMELETGALTPSQRDYRADELKMCKVNEKMAVHLISKMQIKIKSGRR